MKLFWSKKQKFQYHFIAKHFTPFFDLEQYLSDTTMYCCEVRHNEELVAVSIIRSLPELNRITLVYTLVTPSYRRQGINTLIKDAVESFARDENADHLWGHVRENNKASLNSLLKNGYVIVDEGNCFYKNGDRKLTIMKKL